MAQIVGLAFPFGYVDGQFPGSSSDDVSILDSIRQIIETARFERFMRPSSGSNVLKLLFSNNDALLRARLTEEIKRSLREQEKRIDVVRVAVSTQSDSQIVFDIFYKRLGGVLRATIPVDRTVNSE